MCLLLKSGLDTSQQIRRLDLRRRIVANLFEAEVENFLRPAVLADLEVGRRQSASDRAALVPNDGVDGDGLAPGAEDRLRRLRIGLCSLALRW